MTHLFNAAISLSLSRYLDGIRKSLSLQPTAVINKLFSGSPGTNAPPESPPACQPCAEFNSNLPLIRLPFSCESHP